MLKFISKFNISAQLIKQLRDISGSPINECKKALESANGDIEKALVKLKEQGFAQAEKRSGNVAKQGVIAALTDSRIAAIAEINCETDFVARTQEFIDFSTNLMRLVLKHRIPVVEDLYKLREQEYFGGLNSSQNYKKILLLDNCTFQIRKKIPFMACIIIID
ncbi:hypothetical protein pb186bvf_016894 [Paramecium bursaria]